MQNQMLQPFRFFIVNCKLKLITVHLEVAFSACLFNDNLVPQTLPLSLPISRTSLINTYI
jgi:hypothetical protein